MTITPFCRTRAKQEADAAAELQKDLARIEELTVEIRSDHFPHHRLIIGSLAAFKSNSSALFCTIYPQMASALAGGRLNEAAQKSEL